MDWNILFLGMHPKNFTADCRDTCACPAAPLTVAKKWNQPRYPCTDGQRMKM